ncbi:MAG: phosphoesterase, partial [Gemmatimonadetes bacterium]|nr:phosphoesterase [Gemmatimonadota bacterium]
PPTPIWGGDAIYPIALNAIMARPYGLSWMVATDHGGPNHSKVNLEQAYPELQLSREVVPEVVQFYGMEFDTPGADHSSLIIPHSHDEASTLEEIEHGWAKNEAWPHDPLRNTEPKMLEALRFMRELDLPPVLIANHPSRSATDIGVYGLDHPAEFRSWNNTAPTVAVGMAAAPGHQAVAINPDGSIDPNGPRGGYSRAPTMGGFDQMTARLGGFWDSMLGEGRHWWVTANSDSHVNWREGGSDFWPGEFSKTYVHAEKNHADILDGIRSGRVFVTTGDLVSELYVTASSGNSQTSIGGALEVAVGADVMVTVRVLDPDGANSHGDNPSVARVDVIVGEVGGILTDPSQDTNASTRVLTRFTAAEWTRDGDYLIMSATLEDVQANQYVRVRGTNTDQLEPTPDPRGEDPWTDLWFYSNPIFVTIH